MELKRLFSPITINGLTLKNRVAMPVLSTLYTDKGYPTDRYNRYMWRRAEGGAGLLIAGGCRFDDHCNGDSMLSLIDDCYIEPWKSFTDGVHERGAKVAVQMLHAGRYAHQDALLNHAQVVSASDGFSNYSQSEAHAMTVEEIHQTHEDCAKACVRAKKAGFDAVELCASAGYLPCQFLSPFTNKRTDEYGGSWENRCRFTVELITAVRKAVGPDYPIMMRIAGNDFVKGSNTNTEAVEFAKVIEKAGVDFISVTGGWHESSVPQITGDLPRAGYSYLVAAIKKAVNVPVAASNRINDPIVAEELLAMERCDVVNLGRPLVADPDWCVKAKEGRFTEIRRCVACNQGCLARTFHRQPLECLVNGNAGREYLLEDKKPAKLKNILVVGGGPGGCEFAIKAAELGHTVTLWEKSGRIGGQVHLVAVPPAKKEFLTLISYFEAMLKKLNIKVELNKEATVENVVAGNYDAVVVATGVIPKTLPLPGETTIPVYTAAQVLAREVVVGKDVVIIGGGSVGCETAQYLAHISSISPELLYFLMANNAETPEKIQEMLRTTDRNISIVEILKTLGANFDAGTKWPIIADLRRFGVGRHTLTKVIAVSNDSVTVEKTDKEGKVSVFDIPCDTIIMAVGSRSDNALYEALQGKVPELHNLGDSQKVAKIIDAIRDADTLATEI